MTLNRLELFEYIQIQSKGVGYTTQILLKDRSEFGKKLKQIVNCFFFNS